MSEWATGVKRFYRMLRYGAVEDRHAKIMPHILLAFVFIEMCVEAGKMLAH